MFAKLFNRSALSFLLVVSVFFSIGQTLASNELKAELDQIDRQMAELQLANGKLQNQLNQPAKLEPTPVVVETAEEPTVEPTPTTEVCPPAYLATLAVGFVADLDGSKKDALPVHVACDYFRAEFTGSGAVIEGGISSDGMRLDSCTLWVGAYAYPCSLFIKNLSSMNVVATYEHKNGKNHTLCVATSSKDYNVNCE